MTLVKTQANDSLMSVVQTLPVSLSDRAAAKFLELLAEDPSSAGKVLRVGAKGGGCSGLSYILDFDEKGPFDEEYEIKGVKVIVDQRHTLYIAGMEVDYNEGLNDRGFVFNNPNATSTCGCGESFSA